MLCRACLIDKADADFYASNKTRCKECVKAAVKQNRLKNIEHYRAFDRARGGNPERVAAREAYAKTTEGKLAHARAHKRWAVSNAVRRQANIAVGNAIKAGKLVPQPCFVCGEKAHAHHPDYSRPLDVTWLCPAHHKQAHAIAANDQGSAERKRTAHY